MFFIEPAGGGMFCCVIDVFWAQSTGSTIYLLLRFGNLPRFHQICFKLGVLLLNF